MPEKTASKIALVTDSTCDLPSEIAAARQIEIAAHHIMWGSDHFTSGVDITAATFYERLARDPVLPKTSQPSAGEFAEKFRLAREKNNADAVLCITLSAKLSGTYGSAVAGADLVDFPVRVVDSRLATIPMGLVVLAAADARDRGASLDELVSLAEAASQRAHLFFTVNTLDFLYKGGRIGGAQRFIGTALAIKPILGLKDGVVAAVESVRTRKRAVARLLEIADQQPKTRPVWLGIIDSGSPELPEFQQSLQEKFKPDLFITTTASPVVGVYAGPAALGLGLLPGA